MVLRSAEVEALAPDVRSVAAARGLVAPGLWNACGRDDEGLWGQVRGYCTAVDLREPAFRCSCPSTKLPCKHALALYLLAVEQPEALPRGPRPDWMDEWLRSRVPRPRPAPAPPADPEERQRRLAARDEAVTAGLEELDLFLRDVARQGLAALQGRGYAPWDQAAARLVDAKAPGAASLVRRLGGIVAGGARGDWPGAALELLGRLTLLVEGWRRRETLPLEELADLRTQAGGAWKAEEVLQGPGIGDRWAVVGQRLEVDEVSVQRTWLQGRDSGLTALILEFAYGGQPFPSGLAPATEQDAELVFGPGAFPQRALVRDRRGAARSLPALPRAAGCDGACEELARALTRNPWLERVGVGLREVLPLRRASRWIARDGTGAFLPLDLREGDERVLRALSGGRPLDLFGEWDGRRFLPLAAWTAERGVRLR